MYLNILQRKISHNNQFKPPLPNSLMRLKIKAQPNSGRQEIQKISDDEYKVFSKKSPKDNKANNELEKFLSKHLKKQVKIIKGFTSKRKTIEII